MESADDQVGGSAWPTFTRESIGDRHLTINTAEGILSIEDAMAWLDVPME